MNTNINKRLLFTILLILAIIVLPYWLYIPGLILAMAFFAFYWEAVLLGLLIDVLYGDGIFAGLLSLFGLLILLPLRRRIRSHA